MEDDKNGDLEDIMKQELGQRSVFQCNGKFKWMGPVASSPLNLRLVVHYHCISLLKI